MAAIGRPPTRVRNILLFIPYSLDRVKLCGLLGRIPAEEDAGEGTDGEREDDAPGFDDHRHVSEILDAQGDPHAQQHPDDTSRDTEEDRLDEELVEDIDATGTDTHTEADLTRTLGDTDIHDVHDADTTDEQTDAGDGAAEAFITVFMRYLFFLCSFAF